VAVHYRDGMFRDRTVSVGGHRCLPLLSATTGKAVGTQPATVAPLSSGYPLPHGIGLIPHRRVESGCRISRSEPESDFTWQLLGWANFDSAPISETKLPCLSCVPPVGASRPRVPEFGRSFEIPIASIGQDRPSLQCGNSRDPWASGSGNRVLAAVPEDLKTARPNRYIPVVRALAAPERRPA
jgi:hypothetical protein